MDYSVPVDLVLIYLLLMPHYDALPNPDRDENNEEDTISQFSVSQWNRVVRYQDSRPLMFLLLAIVVVTIFYHDLFWKTDYSQFWLCKTNGSCCLFLSVAFIVFTISACCGAFNQTIVEWLCSGRRTLCCHQCLFLITILIMNLIQVEELIILNMSTKVCELTQEQKTTCDTSCHVELSPELWNA